MTTGTEAEVRLGADRRAYILTSALRISCKIEEISLVETLTSALTLSSYKSETHVNAMRKQAVGIQLVKQRQRRPLPLSGCHVETRETQ